MTSITSAILHTVLLMSPPLITSRRDVAGYQVTSGHPITHHATYAVTRTRCEASWSVSVSWSSSAPVIRSTAA